MQATANAETADTLAAPVKAGSQRPATARKEHGMGVSQNCRLIMFTPPWQSKNEEHEFRKYDPILESLMLYSVCKLD